MVDTLDNEDSAENKGAKPLFILKTCTMGGPQKVANIANTNKEENLATWKSVTTYEERRETANADVLIHELVWNVPSNMDKRSSVVQWGEKVGDQWRVS